MSIDDLMNDESSILNEFLEERIVSGELSEVAEGVAKFVLKNGTEGLSEMQSSVFERYVIGKYGNLKCKLCGEDIPINEAITAIDWNEGYCGRCAYRLEKDDK